MKSLADFSRQVSAVRSIATSATPEKLLAGRMVRGLSQAQQVMDGLTEALATMERLEAGFSIMAARGTKNADLEFHKGSAEVAETLWGRE